MADPYLIAGIYFSALGALILCVFIRGGAPMLRTVLTILAVCVLGWSYSWFVSYDTDYSVFMIAVDALAARVILWHPAGKWQSVIGLTYILQIGVHIGRLASNNPDLYVYGLALPVLAFLQLVLVAGWWGHELYLRRRGRAHHPLVTAARRKGVGG